MSSSELRFTKTHEWLLADGDSAKIGLSDYAQHELGDIVFVELPAVGRAVKAGEVIATVESVKSVSEMYAPVSGTVTEVNSALDASPGLVNSDPMGAGWVVKLSIADRAELGALLTPEAYEKETGA
jgi:glycine cleavage system H protein